MNDFLKLISVFEERNNISVSILLHSDCSGIIREFWDEDFIKKFDNKQELFNFLEDGKLKMVDGRSVNPIEIIN